MNELKVKETTGTESVASQPLKVKALDTSKYFNQNELTKIFVADETLQYLGLMVDKGIDDVYDSESIDKFLIKCKEVIDSDIFEGILSLVMKMDLVCLDKKRKVMVYRDGRRAHTSNESENDKSITKREDIEFRGMLLFYFKSKISREALIDRFGNHFYLEGQIPDKW